MTEKISDKKFPFIELCGALHLHTTFSDGGVSYPEMIDAAKQVLLDYLVITDHMTMKARDQGFEGFSENLFVCVGYEHNDEKNHNHYLAMGADTVVKPLENPQEYINKVKEQGGIGFLAHPMEKRNYFAKYPPYPWTAWDATGFDGMELWNQMSDWLENLKSWLDFIRLFYPRRFLKHIEPEMLAKWDLLNKDRFVSGIGGVDAHTQKIRLGIIPLTIFPIKVELKGIRTHLYFSEALPVNDTLRAKTILLDALKKGRGFISNYRRCDARGTQIMLQGADGMCHAPGTPEQDVVFPAELTVKIPEQATIKLIKNGKQVDAVSGSYAAFPITNNGLYRVEVFRGSYGWIYSNPFCVGRYPLW